MAEEKSVGVKGTLSGWIKAGLTSVFGLVSGACLMYLTPVINNTIKPAKPLANFAAQVNGLTVTFNNHSTGGVDGWWDFGDGTALETFSPKQAAVTHVYDKPGSYTVKLLLQNILGEENDRAVPVNLDGSMATKPDIEQFEVIPISSGEQVPALYQLKSRVKNAIQCLLVPGDDQPIQLGADQTMNDRLITFKEMGSYTIRLVAINGKDISEKSKVVCVSPSASSDPLAKLTVSYEAARVERTERKFHVSCDWQKECKEDSCPVQVERQMPPGFLITAAQILNKDEKNIPIDRLNLQITPDKTRFVLSGILNKSKKWFGPRAGQSWKAEVKVVMERRSAPVFINRGDVMMAVSLNHAVKIPMQPLEPGWDVLRTQLNLELWDGTKKIWESHEAVKNAPVRWNKQTCYITAVPQADGMQVRIDAATTAPGISSAPRLNPAPTTTPLKGQNTSVPRSFGSVVAPPLVEPAIVPTVVRPTSFERAPYLLKPKSN